MNDSLQCELQTIMDARDPFGIHIQKILNCCEKNNQQIDIIPTTGDAARFNCHMYTLGIHYSDIAYQLGRKYAKENRIGNGEGKQLISGPFLEKLILSDILIDHAEGKVGIYYDQHGNIKHSGIFQDNKNIISKWGQLSALWKHSVWTIPASYGQHVKRFILKASQEEIIESAQREVKKVSSI